MYELTKLSYPGFELRSTHEEVIIEIISRYICEDCREYYYTSYSGIEKVKELLISPCGAEFMLEEVEVK